MIASAPTDGAALLDDLYGRQKRLLLSAGAALALDRLPVGALEEAERLAADCRAAAGAARDERFAACREAADRLVELLADAQRRSGAPSDSRLAAARAAHSRLRRLVWEHSGCEYVPCGAGDGGTHHARQAKSEGVHCA